jgi:hypothetical protein
MSCNFKDKLFIKGLHEKNRMDWIFYLNEMYRLASEEFLNRSLYRQNFGTEVYADRIFET